MRGPDMQREGHAPTDIAQDCSTSIFLAAAAPCGLRSPRWPYMMRQTWHLKIVTRYVTLMF